jgi:hypothetical protein
MKGTGSSGYAVLPAPPRVSIRPRAAGGNFYPQLRIFETQTQLWMTLACCGLEVQ